MRSGGFYDGQMGDVPKRDRGGLLGWLLRRRDKTDQHTEAEPETDAGTHTGIGTITLGTSGDATGIVGAFLITSEQFNIPELPRLILEADDDGCARWIGTLTSEHNDAITEPLQVLLWLWADGSIHMATRSVNYDTGWSIPTYPQRI